MSDEVKTKSEMRGARHFGSNRASSHPVAGPLSDRARWGPPLGAKLAASSPCLDHNLTPLDDSEAGSDTLLSDPPEQGADNRPLRVLKSATGGSVVS